MMRDKLDTGIGHKYLDVLKYCYEHPTFTRNEIKECLKLNDAEFQRFVVGVAQIDPNCDLGAHDPDCVWVMSLDSFLGYLDYIELKEARESSKSAKKYAILAIAISGFLALASICLTIYQMTISSDVKLVQSQAGVIQSLETGISKIQGQLQDIGDRQRQISSDLKTAISRLDSSVVSDD